jgi:hypothetical protein
MFKTIAAIVCAAALVMLAVALAPNVPTALATAPPAAVSDDAKLSQPVTNQPVTKQSCAVFEVWFLNPACSKARVKKAARTKHHLARNAR